MCLIVVKAVLFAIFIFLSQHWVYPFMITKPFQKQETYCKRSELALFLVSSPAIMYSSYATKAVEELGNKTKQNFMK